MDTETRRAKLFYAESLAGLYDETIALVVPHYGRLHESMRQLMRMHAGQMTAPFVVLDVGSGTGIESRAMLAEAPQASIVALDLCAPMHDVHRRHLSPEEASRVRFVTDDVTRVVASPSGLRSLLPSAEPGFGAVISAFAVHHLEHAEKAAFYRAAFESLRPGGRLILGDLFSAADEEVAALNLAHDLEWIQGRFDDAAVGGSVSANEATCLAGRWLRHYREENECEPLEDGPAGPGQLTMLRTAGFQSVSVTYRFTMSGVVTATRP